jgi:hypothetical protein
VAAHWTQVEACTRHPVVERGRQQHGVQGDSAEWRRGHRHARQGLLKRIGNKIVHATVDDFKRRRLSHGRHPAAGRARPLDLIDWVSPTKAVYMSEAAKAIDFTTTVDVHAALRIVR